jgi:DNA-directed RNA polymerase specialized sigma subunit
MSVKFGDWNEEQFRKLVQEEVTKILNSKIQPKNNRNDKADYYKKTEKLLYSYSILKRLEGNTDEYISDCKKDRDMYIDPARQAEIVEDRLTNRHESLTITKMDLAWIDKALSQVWHKEEYEVVRLIYLCEYKMTISDAAEHLYISESTVRRWRKRMIEEIGILLFGSICINI